LAASIVLLHAALLTLRTAAPGRHSSRMLQRRAARGDLWSTPARWQMHPTKPKPRRKPNWLAVASNARAVGLALALSGSDRVRRQRRCHAQANGVFVQQQALLLAQVKDLLAQLPPPQPKKPEEQQDPLDDKRLNCSSCWPN
jgi:hypothetical protein